MHEREFSDLSYVDFVANDADLVTFHELHIRGETTEDRVSPQRESWLLEQDHEQLMSDLMLVYAIDRAQAIKAEQLCIVTVYEQMKAQERLLYGDEA